MRSQDEIAEQVRRTVAQARPMAEFAVLLPCLDYAHAFPFLEPTATAEAWETDELTLTAEEVTTDAIRCMAGAWSELADHDRQRASRLIGNFRAYVWLLGADWMIDQYDAVPARPFGAPKFGWVAKTFGWPGPTTAAAIRMADGWPCTDLCISGCR